MADNLYVIENKYKKLIKDFSSLLESITNVDAKQKMLWIQIYNNAIQDREHAYENLTTLMNICEEKSTEYAVHGKAISLFIERASKANDQLIKLSDTLKEYTSSQEEVSVDSLYDSM